MAEQRRRSSDDTPPLWSRMARWSNVPGQIAASLAAKWLILGFIGLQPWFSRDQVAYASNMAEALDVLASAQVAQAAQIDTRINKLTGAVEGLLETNLLMRWTRLNDKRMDGGLTAEELREFCTLSIKFNFSIPNSGCR